MASETSHMPGKPAKRAHRESPCNGRRVFGGIAGQKNECLPSKKGRGIRAPAHAGSFSRPGLAIPCWVAPQHCPTPFHPATSMIPRNNPVGMARVQNPPNAPTGSKAGLSGLQSAKSAQLPSCL